VIANLDACCDDTTFLLANRGNEESLVRAGVLYRRQPNVETSQVDLGVALAKANDGIGVQRWLVAVRESSALRTIVGCEAGYLERRRAGGAPFFPLIEGRYPATSEAAVGHRVARRPSSSSIEIDGRSYTVVGRLAETHSPADLACFVVDPIGEMPSHSCLAVVESDQPQRTNEILASQTNLAFIQPKRWIVGMRARYLDPPFHVLVVVTWIAMLILATAWSVTFSYGVSARQRELAVLRIVGATRSDIARLVVAVCLILLAGGLVVGWGVSRWALLWTAAWLEREHGLPLDPWRATLEEVAVACAVLTIGLLSSLRAAMKAYRMEASSNLRR
jgi:putative ABC transport system permease protein